jgi:ribosomal-protein-alanine N-acetyltransferase
MTGDPARAAFRAMAESDLDVVYANEIDAYPYPWTRQNFVDCLRERKDCRVVIAADVVVGHGVLAVAVGEAHILNVCVAPRLQGYGFGRVLLTHLLERAAHLGAELVFLEVRPSNAPALALYDAAGFNEIGRRRGYYPAALGREDALVLALDLRVADLFAASARPPGAASVTPDRC